MSALDDRERIPKKFELEESEFFQLQVRYILNRLSPNNFNKLVIEFMKLPLNCQEKLKDCIYLIWSKAKIDHIYIPLYARLCKMMSETRIDLEFMPDRYISFGMALSKKCEQELNRDYKSHIDVSLLKDEIKRTSDAKKKRQLEGNFESLLSEAKHEYVGNLIFMAELFELDMIEDHILFNGIENLFKRVQEGSYENIEFICKLISLIAPKLIKHSTASLVDTNKLLDDFVSRLKNLEIPLKSKQRFAIMDIVDMKSRDWAPQQPQHSSALHRLEKVRAEFESEQDNLIKSLTLHDSLSDLDTDSESSSLISVKEMLSFDYAKHVYDVYTTRNDHIHALKDIESVKSIDLKEFVRDLISIGFYKDVRARKSVGTLVYKSLKENLISIENFANGLKLFFSSLKQKEDDRDNDSLINVPAQIGEILSELFQIDYIRLDFLVSSFETLSGSKLLCEIVTEMLKSCSARLGQQLVLDILELSEINVRDLFERFKCGGVDILKQNGLDWALESTNLFDETEVDRFKRQISQLMSSNFNLDEAISKFNTDETKRNEFLRALVEIIVENCWVKDKIDVDLFKLNFKKALKTVICQNESKQLDVLYVIQEIDFKLKHQKGFLEGFLALMFDQDLINVETYHRWKNEPKGKGYEIAQLILGKFLKSFE